MKSKKGVTLLTLMIFVVGMTIIVGIVTVITNYFYRNIMQMEANNSSSAEYNKFNVSFLEEVKTYGNKLIEIADNYVVFSSGNKYLFQDNKIYKNKITIVKDVANCTFDFEQYEAKQIVSVDITLGGEKGFTSKMDYVVSYDWNDGQIVEVTDARN